MTEQAPRVRLPDAFVPYETLIVCSNRAIRCSAIIAKGSEPLLVVGKGTNHSPLVYLSLPAGLHSPKLSALVVGNKVLVPAIAARMHPPETELTLQAETAIRLLHVRELEPDCAEVDYLDLRPLRLAVFGTADLLVAGGMKLSGNVINGAAALIAIPEREPKFQPGQYVMRTSMTPEQQVAARMPPPFGERAGKYPWDRLQVVGISSDQHGYSYVCRQDDGRIERLREEQLREVDPSEKHGWRGE